MAAGLQNEPEALSLLSSVIERRGYLVGSCIYRLEIGVIVEGLNLTSHSLRMPVRHPFRVTKETDRCDWDEQSALISTLNSLDWDDSEDGPYFFRLMTD
jgi:hypothetical protein